VMDPITLKLVYLSGRWEGFCLKKGYSQKREPSRPIAEKRKRWGDEKKEGDEIGHMEGLRWEVGSVHLYEKDEKQGPVGGKKKNKTTNNNITMGRSVIYN